MSRILSLCVPLLLLSSTGASATSVTCWDGRFVIDANDCIPRPEPLKFRIFGGPADGGEVSIFKHNDQIFKLEAVLYGATGNTLHDFLLPDTFHTIETTYNRPFLHPDYNRELSTKTRQNYEVETTAEGKFVFRLNGEISYENICLYEEVIAHISKYEKADHYPNMQYDNVERCVSELKSR